ncbi:TVP38/TMEM64 family protein [Paenibacillus validus]|uniref:TVP38/TMEM64 family membrane protein n=1 Tax=Paenibacillus validus TaxID=44253 RepID=A0A7X2ZAC0_9BACL|nr:MULTISPECIES: TVP38/TMEM64 family protein [Paenibacillus]MED4600279.1 TVP38/TMEM64 family protein [Paenibacillus validus]MED4606976.1 TVP38/TMEM64 family protein [Paenibacillus validus]MUG71253.1 TVP38/TMEM64 family protein [Paenibacillus validus]
MISYLTEDNLKDLLERYRSLGPLPGILLTFLKSFIPPLPTIVIVGVNAAVYGLWLGFFYSWLGMVSGCLVTFQLVRRISGHPYLEKWARRPKVERSMRWVRRNAFGYVFLLSLFPVGPFVVVNMAAGLAGMRLRSFLIAILFGKAIMVFYVSYIGYDLERYIRNPAQIVYVLLFIGASLWASKKIEAYYTRERGQAQNQSHPDKG